MAVLPIRTFGDPILKEPAIKADPRRERLDELVKNLAETMYNAPGLGLAATQVGVMKQVFVFDIEDGLKAFTNPKIIWASEETEEAEEGCLSLPEVHIRVPRAAKIKVELTDMSGNKRVVEAEGLLARVLQHEIDHLSGRLILDRADRAERKSAIKTMNELRMGRM
ncbi:MAG: peptide deformylase [Actinobacteria bacterium]|nr:MAG: peptide deformylase [Actinomycetota bacterium]